MTGQPVPRRAGPDPGALDARGVLAGAPGTAAADPERGRPPDRVVTVVRSDQGVGDLVEDGVAHLRLRVDRGEWCAQPDLLAAGPADARAALGPVEEDAPVAEPVLVQQPPAQLRRLVQVH